MSDRQEPGTALRQTLDDLERLLSEERLALRVLDARTIDEVAAKKLAVDAKLRGLLEAGVAPTLDERAQFVRVRDGALVNQRLLLHARACVTSVLAMATGQAPATYAPGPTKPPAAQALRVDTRG